jgi:Rhodopirellula transposase DDE domain
MQPRAPTSSSVARGTGTTTPPKAIPYGVYDIDANDGFVSVGVDHDTAPFAVNAIRTWWQRVGRQRYPKAKRLLVTADAGGSNGYRLRAWKVELAKLAAEIGRDITVVHFPPGTSKWNKDRAPAVLVHLHQLARPTTHRLPGHRRDHCGHDHQHRAHRRGRPRPQHLPNRAADHQGTGQRRSPYATRVCGEWN